MPSENDFEIVLTKYPDLIEEGLRLLGRQITLHGSRMDLVFEDSLGRQLIVELKWGPIKDAHIGQILRYEGLLLSSQDPTIRVMLIGNRVPPNLAHTLDHHGISWREITAIQIVSFLRSRNDDQMAAIFDQELKPDLRQTQYGGKPLFKADSDSPTPQIGWVQLNDAPIEPKLVRADDRDTFKNFNEAQLHILAELRRDLGPKPLRTEIKHWFNKQEPAKKYGPAWIVKNRFIVTNNPNGIGAICILDPTQMPDQPFPLVVDRKSKKKKPN